MPHNHIWLLSGCAYMLLAPSARAMVIDDFQQGPLDWMLSGTYSSAEQTLLMGSLDSEHTIGGSRFVYGSTLNAAHLQIATDPGRFQFNASVSFGYFELSYGSTSSPLNLNLLADGSDAFLVDFLEVTPGLWRGLYYFMLTTPAGEGTYSIADELFALSGGGRIRIPYSHFDSLDLTNISSIAVGGARVESTFRITIGSITTVPEPTTWIAGALSIALAALAYRPLHSRLR